MRTLFVLGAIVAALTIGTAASANEWEKQVVQAIQAEQTYPRSAIVRGDEGMARIRVHVAPDGRVSDVVLVRASGSAILDREAMRMPTKAGVVPAHPAGEASVVEIPIRFKLTS